MLYIPYKDTFKYVGFKDQLVYNHINKKWYIQKKNSSELLGFGIPVMVPLLGFGYVPTTYEKTSDELRKHIRKNWLNSLRYMIDNRYERLPARLKSEGAKSEAFLVIHGSKTLLVSEAISAKAPGWKLNIKEVVHNRATSYGKRVRSFGFSDGRTLNLEHATVKFRNKRLGTTVIYDNGNIICSNGNNQDGVVLPNPEKLHLERMVLTICIRHPWNCLDRQRLVLDIDTKHRTMSYDINLCWHETIQPRTKYYDIDDKVFPYTPSFSFPKDIAVGASQQNADRAVECLLRNIYHFE